MKRTMITAVASLSLLLGGCATTIRSDVTTFNQWPAQLPDKSYAFETRRRRTIRSSCRAMKTSCAPR